MSTKRQEPVPRDSYEQQLWDDIIRSLVSRGEPAGDAVRYADEVIRGRRAEQIR